MTKEILKFSKAADSDAVYIDLRITVDGEPEPFHRQAQVSDKAMTAAAVAAGRSAWDERDLEAATGAVMYTIPNA